ncbi:MAG TPA: hypothetical protein VGE97_01035 [Nitrososphaera sp.]
MNFTVRLEQVDSTKRLQEKHIANAEDSSKSSGGGEEGVCKASWPILAD